MKNNIIDQRIQSRAMSGGTGSVDTQGTPFGCTCEGLFNSCADNAVLSLSLQGDVFLDWIGWQKTNVCLIKKEFIAYQRPSQYNGSDTAGAVSNPCADGNGFEFGRCDFTLTDFGRYRRVGPTRDMTMNEVRYCENSPRWRLDGEPISSEDEWDAHFIGEILLQDLRNAVVEGNNTSGGQFDGLERLVKTGYTNANGETCQLMDSIVINWNSNNTEGGAGITWNGNAVGATYDIIDVLLDVYRHIRQRISWSPTLAANRMQVGDMVLVLPWFAVKCILDKFTCWTVCPGAQYNETNLNTYEARAFRNSLLGGAFQAGKIYLDGFEIPLLPYDWGMINGGDSFDMYLLTNAIGGIRLINFQYLDLTGAVRGYPDSGYEATDGGRFLTWVDTDQTCVRRSVEVRPRLLMWAPWAQARIYNIMCAGPGPVISVDPGSSYLMEDSSGFYASTCS